MITIPSRPTHEEYAARDFYDNQAFRRACRDEGIPLDTPIPEQAAQLAEQAFAAACAPSRKERAKSLLCMGWVGPVSDDAAGLWRRAREVLRVRKVEAA